MSVSLPNCSSPDASRVRRTMRILCVAEKPSIAKEVSNILSGGRIERRNSPNTYVKNFDFNFNFAQWGHCEVTMTSVLGHLDGLSFPNQLRDWNGPIDPLFTCRVFAGNRNATQKQVATNISNEARRADILFIWTDCDREGEHIGFEIFEAAKVGNSRFDPTSDTVQRARFSHLERNHVLYAANHPVKLDMKQVEAVSGRFEIDLRAGSAFTRKLTQTVNRRRDQIVSYGTCQFPTLGFVVDRYRRVKEFIPEAFWHIILTYKPEDQSELSFNWCRGRFFDRLYVYLIYQRGWKHSKLEAKAKRVNRSPITKYRPLPLTTVDLQKDCSRYFRISAKKALDAAEKLYNKGFISYPRTETNAFPSGFDHKGLAEKQVQDDRWGDYTRQLISNGIQEPRQGSKDDKAHPPIHPVKYTNIRGNSDEAKVYEYVVRRYLAGISKDAYGSKSTIILEWGSPPEDFSASGVIVEEKNFLEVYPYIKWNSSRQLPRIEQGELLEVKAARMVEGKTTKPEYLTETDLIALMDVNGIGTDATIADHIDKITQREYIVKQKTGSREVLIPTPLGMGLIEGFDKVNFEESMSKPFLRRHLEKQLQRVCEGEITKEQAVREFIGIYREAFSLLEVRTGTFKDTCNSIMTEFG